MSQQRLDNYNVDISYRETPPNRPASPPSPGSYQGSAGDNGVRHVEIDERVKALDHFCGEDKL